MMATPVQRFDYNTNSDTKIHDYDYDTSIPDSIPDSKMAADATIDTDSETGADPVEDIDYDDYNDYSYDMIYGDTWSQDFISPIPLVIKINPAIPVDPYRDKD